MRFNLRGRPRRDDEQPAGGSGEQAPEAPASVPPPGADAGGAAEADEGMIRWSRGGADDEPAAAEQEQESRPQDEPAPVSREDAGDRPGEAQPWHAMPGDRQDEVEAVEPLSMAPRDDEEEEPLSRHAPLPTGFEEEDEERDDGQRARAAGEEGGGEGDEGSDFGWEEPTREREPAGAQASASRVSVVDEPHARPAPPEGADEEEYKWHTYRVYPSGRPDAIEFIDVYKAFGRNQILRGLNMGLPEGMVSMILGPSGTGKSVCIKHMVGLLYPDQGDIIVHGESVPNMADDDLFEMRKKFGLLFQDGALFGSMNLFDNVAFPLRQHTEKGEDEVEEIVMRRLGEVGLADARERMPNELSGGMRKRAGFARALVLEPDIVLFDEPDSGLDPVRTALLGELILEIHRDMMEEAKEKQREHLPTFCVITHDIMSARRVADFINVLWKGRIVEAGPAEDMLNSDNPFIRQFLSGESQGPLTMD
jgi:phospholipid/cholesterol/gamma-HCH transport system ATP-binding protein